MRKKNKRSLLLVALFIGLFLGVLYKVQAQDKELSNELNIYNWEDYFGPTTLKDFEKRFGVKVNLETFSDEEEMISNLQAHPEKYDIM